MAVPSRLTTFSRTEIDVLCTIGALPVATTLRAPRGKLSKVNSCSAARGVCQRKHIMNELASLDQRRALTRHHKGHFILQEHHRLSCWVTAKKRGNTVKFPRRQFLQLMSGAAAAFPTVWRTARAEIYPTRPVRLLVGFEPGGPSDIVARLIGQWPSERFSQQLIIEKRSGAASNIATEAVARAAPDGDTLPLG